GHLLWKQHKTDSAITCLQKYQARDLLSFPFLAHPARFVQTFWLIAKNNIRSVLVAVGDKGKISLLNSKGGAVVWETEELGLKTTCPQYLDAKLYFGSLNSVFATAITDGKQSLITNYGDGYFFKPIPSPYNDTLRTIFPFLPVSLFVGDAHGKLHAFSPAGKELWEFSIFGAVNKNLLFDNTYVYFSGTDGAVYRINRDTGVPPTPNKQVAVNQQMSRVGLNNIEEITIHFDDRWYSNPWKDIKVSAQFIHESGTKFVVDGFYYDKNIWKIRFNPPIKGKWNWQLSFEAPGNTKHYSGSFVSTTDTTATFIKIYDKNPKRFTLDNKTIFNGIGIGDAIFDRNLNGSPLDDWFTEDTETDASASGTKSGNYYTDNKMNLDQYLSAYGSQGKFNMFRWSVNNASFNLWRNFSINNKFLITEGKYGDELARSLKNHGFQIWLTVFSFDIPFAYQYPNELKAMRQYIRYIVARYGPYVSVWEISNEAYAPEALVQFIAQEIRAADIEKRPISMSHILPDMNEISIIAPHWYETENASVSDTQTVQKISTYQNYNKPVVFAEQGNATPDNPDDSGLRMRIRSWTAFFNEAILIFWNQSDQRVYSVGSYTNANLYIGAKERLVIANLQKFTQGVDVSAVTTTFLTDNPYVRAYGLDSNAGLLGYFYHYTDWELKTSFSTTVILSRDAVLSWYDPETGTTLQEQTLSSGANEIRSPKFSIDIALKVTYAPTN
ncbi:MAG: DUF5060 domain-containing protein, partial [Candidatus Gottesmanbacteria bacterium]|nr:DUF5060 domain-containing protein [Candidatus Gottesmanbacteria bacterium]